MMQKIAELYGKTLSQLLREMDETPEERRKREFAEDTIELVKRYKDIFDLK